MIAIAILQDRQRFDVQTGASSNWEYLMITTGPEDAPGYTLKYQRTERGLVKEALLQAVEALERRERIEVEALKRNLDVETYWRLHGEVKQEIKEGTNATHKH